MAPQSSRALLATLKHFKWAKCTLVIGIKNDARYAADSFKVSAVIGLGARVRTVRGLGARVREVRG